MTNQAKRLNTLENIATPTTLTGFIFKIFHLPGAIWLLLAGLGGWHCGFWQGLLKISKKNLQVFLLFTSFSNCMLI